MCFFGFRLVGGSCPRQRTDVIIAPHPSLVLHLLPKEKAFSDFSPSPEARCKTELQAIQKLPHKAGAFLILLYFRNFRSFAGKPAQVIKFCPSYLTALNNGD